MELEGVAAMGEPGRSFPRGARGAVNALGLLLLLGAVAAGYLAWVFVPVWVLHYEVKQVVRDYGNQAVKDLNDAGLAEAMVGKIRSLHRSPGLDAAGRVVMVPTVALDRRDVVWERFRDPPRLHVAFEYPREIELPFLNRTVEKTFQVDLDMDLARADWGPQR
jgi:hypothetical protein